jgi:hypothetical protein
MTTFEIFSLLMLLLQVLHILEDIAFKAYEVAGNLNKYLFAASVLLTGNFGTFFIIGNQIHIGLYLGLLTAWFWLLAMDWYTSTGGSRPDRPRELQARGYTPACL